MRKQARSRRYGITFGGACLALALGLVIVGATLYDKNDIASASSVASLVSFGMSAVSAGSSLWSWWRKAGGPSVVTPEQIAKGKGALALLVAQQWETEAHIRSLDDPYPMPVQWRITSDPQVMDRPGNLASSSPLLTANSHDIAALAEKFREMRRRRLVMLGGPGAGKTTLAVQLVRELLGSRLGREDEPVPVLLSAAGWDTKVFPELRSWLVSRLAQDYPALHREGLAPEMPRRLVEHGAILPVLDGLDELSESAQADVITALNRSLTDSDQLILTSRTEEFRRATEAAGDILTSAVVIESEPIHPDVAADYLELCLPPRHHPAWDDVLNVLRGLSSTETRSGPVGALAEIARTPLGLWLIRSVYANAHGDPSGLLDHGRFPDLAALRAHLFDELIPALIASRPPSGNPADIFRPRHHYDAGEVRTWLGNMARHLNGREVTDGNTGIRDFAWWQLARDTDAITVRARIAAGVVVFLVVGLSSGLAAQLAAGLSFGLAFGADKVVGIGLLFGLVVGLVAGVLVGLTANAWPQSAPGFADLRMRGRLAGLGHRLVIVVAPGLLVGIVISVLDWRLLELLAAALATGVAGSLALGLTTWAEAPFQTGPPASTPLGSWQADRALYFVRIIAFGFAFGLAVGLAVGLSLGSLSSSAFGISFAAGYTFDLKARLAVGFAFGIAFGLAGGSWGGFCTGNHRAWIAYVLATYRLAWRRQLPRNLMLFLDDAHRLGLLRGVGPIYQFRHAEFQDHLAESCARLSYPWRGAGEAAVTGSRVGP